MIKFQLSQCETADHHAGPWRDIVDGKTARWVRVKQSDWDAATGPGSGFEEREGVPSGTITLMPGYPLS